MLAVAAPAAGAAAKTAGRLGARGFPTFVIPDASPCVATRSRTMDHSDNDDLPKPQGSRPSKKARVRGV